MRMMTIASGSSGNCIYVGSDNTHILIDSGVSRKKILEGLAAAELSLKDISAIFITHEHSDHIKGLDVISRKDEIPVYATRGTIQGIMESGIMKDSRTDFFNEISAGQDIFINDLSVKPFAISHDANEPVAYTVRNGGKKIGIATDLGFYDDYTVENLKGSDALLVEANHDVNLLQVGSYPYYLKQRILSNRGHLSNEASGRLIDSVLNNKIKHIFLGHLSKENNYDKLAFETVRLEIDMSESCYKAMDFDIEVAKRSEHSDIIMV